MKKHPGTGFKVFKSWSVASSFRGVQCFRCVLRTLLVLVALSVAASAQQVSSSQHSAEIAIQGTVHNKDGSPVGDAVVRLAPKDISSAVETKTNSAGVFTFSNLVSGSYVLSAERSGLRSRAVAVAASSQGEQRAVDLILTASPIEGMTFADEPNFTVAGVTDWTAVGGHGSDSSLRTSEVLANETLTLKPEKERGTRAGTGSETERKLRADLAAAPQSFEANHRLGEFYLHSDKFRESIPLLENAYRIDSSNHDNEYQLALAYAGSGDISQAREHVHTLLMQQENADVHRLAGELDERSGDPLAAVHQYEQAARLDPSERNYFEWGSELLLHRAVWQAQEVFRKGSAAYPKSARMQTGLGAALFAGARYDEAALQLCSASDLDPADPEPYLFMGRIEMAAPDSLGCVEQKLARFVQAQPENSLANYFYAMAILKRQQQSADKQAVQKAQDLLTKAISIDAKCSDAYLQLGILSASERKFDKAIDFYRKAIDANPQMGEAHYRLGVAYDRMGEPVKAKEEFQLHDEIKKRDSEAIERQRREVKQFLVVLPGQADHAPVP